MKRGPRPDDWFENVAEKWGVNFAYRDSNEAGFYQLLESVGGGCAIFDYDDDGDVDLFVTGGGVISGPPLQATGRPCGLFRNDGLQGFTNTTEEAGLTSLDFYSHGCTIGDFNRDGMPDIFVVGFHGCRLWQNNGRGVFSDVTQQTGITVDRWGVTGACLDYDRDGWLDIYIVTYADWQLDHERVCLNDKGLRDVCGPTLFEGSRDYLWRNRGDGTFEDVTDQAGLVEANRGLGVVIADFDENGHVDIYVVNDVQENQLYLGDGELPFAQQGVVAGVAFSELGEREGSMGVDIGDFDGDGLADLWYTNYTNQDNSLYRKVDGIGYLGVTSVMGIGGKSRRWVGFGTGFADFDSDGWQDLFVANGHVAYDRIDGPYFQPAQLFRNVGGSRFEEATEIGGPYFSVPHAGRGAAVGDLDNDGGLDLVIVHQNDPVAILRNRQPAKRWVRVLLKGVASNWDAVGAKVALLRDDDQPGRSQVRWVRGGGGYCSFFDRRILFPLSDEQASAAVSVTWPAGRHEIFADLTPGTTHVLTEGMGR